MSGIDRTKPFCVRRGRIEGECRDHRNRDAPQIMVERSDSAGRTVTGTKRAAPAGLSIRRLKQQKRQLSDVEKQRQHGRAIAEPLVFGKHRHRKQIGDHRGTHGQKAEPQLDTHQHEAGDHQRQFGPEPPASRLTRVRSRTRLSVQVPVLMRVRWPCASRTLGTHWGSPQPRQHVGRLAFDARGI